VPRGAAVKLSIVIVSFNSRQFIEPCVRSLAEEPGTTEHEIVVVDNASSDGSAEAAQAFAPGITVIANRRNLGFGRAANQGFQKTSGEYVLVLNPDVTATPGSLGSMIRFMDGHGDTGLLLPKLLNPNGTVQPSCRTFYTLPVLLLRRTPLGAIFRNARSVRAHLMADWDHARVREVDWGLGAAMLLRRAAIGDGVPFDERFFIYFEDVDLCARLSQAGWKVVYFPEAALIHCHLRQSATGWWNRARFEHLKSLVKFIRKYRGLRPRTSGSSHQTIAFLS
jgi:N-acetylglucosaminyl-diphospho-decaprenol L-rhamnosyltransferase